MKIRKFLLLMLMLTPFTFAGQEWCWTKSMANEASFILDAQKGGLNWGYCQKEASQQQVSYSVTITTSSMENSGTSSKLGIKLFGDKGSSDFLMLATGLDRGQDKVVQITTKDVGFVQKISLKLSGNQGYRCKSIMIKKGNQTFSFDCVKRMEPCEGNLGSKCKLNIYENGNIPYDVTIKTSDAPGIYTKNQIHFSIIGSNGESGLRVFSDEGMGPSVSVTHTLDSRDVGEITGFKLILAGDGSLKPSSIVITNSINQNTKAFEIPSTTQLSSPGSDTLNISDSASDGASGLSSGNLFNAGGPNIQVTSSSNPFSERSSSSSKSNQDVHDPLGGLINSNEKKKIIKLTCKQKLINTGDEMLFGPDFPTQKVNYLNVLASCPANCHKESDTVLGVGVHPENSSICLSAIVDRAISLYGGIISISVVSGMNEYPIPENFPEKLGNISIQPYYSDTVKKSYTLAKVDNVDLIDKDIRIVNFKGELASEGRLEFRLEGKWGTVCSNGNDPIAARVICKNLGYREGDWKTPGTSCNSFNDRDYCGAVQSPIHFSNIVCEDTTSNNRETSFNECNKQLADYTLCSHSNDAIISCYNEVFDSTPPVPTGVVRLAANKNISNDEVIGRLEIYNNQKWGSICNIGFNQISANVACKQMGFDSGEYEKDISKATEFMLSEEDTSDFGATNVDCKEKETSLLDCGPKLKNIQCKHNQDTVVICKGNGDISGESQYLPKPVTNPPKLGKLGLLNFPLSCKDRATNPQFRGDPGSVFIVSCPANCSKYPIGVTGNVVYTSDSNICAAAIHEGVISDIHGGIFALVKTFGLNKYEQDNSNGILTTSLAQKWFSSFTLSKINSGWMGMVDLMNKALPFTRTKDKFLLNSSFLQLTSMIRTSVPKPVFAFYEPKPDTKFSSQTNFIYEEVGLSGLSTYSFLIQFTMEKFNHGESMYLFSYSGCNGFNVYINENDRLIIGDPCGPSHFETPLLVPLNTNIVLLVSYSNQDNLNIFIQSDKFDPINILKNETKVVIGTSANIGIGRIGTSESQVFYGEINFALLYNSIIDPNMIPVILEDIENRAKETEVKRITMDNRLCITPCSSSVNGGSGKPPEAARLDISGGYIPLPNNRQNNKNPGAILESLGSAATEKLSLEKTEGLVNKFGTYDVTQKDNQETMEIDCSVDLTDSRFNGAPGKMFRVRCLSCHGTEPVFGTGTYHPLSKICRAAGHFGIKNDRIPGEIIVTLGGSHSAFNGSQGSFKITSSSMKEKQDRSFSVGEAKPLKVLTCDATASDDEFASFPELSKFVVKCPNNCDISKAFVAGTDTYHTRSSICVAAIHYGVSSKEGGEIEFMITGQQNLFKGSIRFGVTSVEEDGNIRGFTFVGSKSALAYKFKEDYSGKIENKWEILTNPNAIDKNKVEFRYERSESMQAIIYNGIASESNLNSFAAMIILKNADFVNGTIKFNLRTIGKDTSPFGVIFRYHDVNNFYGIIFNMKEKDMNVKLISNLNSTYSVIKQSSFSQLDSEIWLRCTLVLEFETLKFFVQGEKQSGSKHLFTENIKEFSRGSIGFGVNGIQSFIMEGIEIQDLKPVKVESERTFIGRLGKINQEIIQKYCHDNFRDESEQAVLSCSEPHQYCSFKCDQLVNQKIEGILNYKCYKECLVKVKEANSKLLGESGSVPLTKWMPKKGLKVDYMYESGHYTSATVIDVGNDSSASSELGSPNLIVTLEYRDISGTTTTAEVYFPDDSILQCGSKLSQRIDCLDNKTIS